MINLQIRDINCSTLYSTTPTTTSQSKQRPNMTMKSHSKDNISISQITNPNFTSPSSLNSRNPKMTTHRQRLISHGSMLTISMKSTALLCSLSTCILLALLSGQQCEARMNIIAPTPPNQFYLNEFCDLHSKAPINKNKHKQDSETKLFLKNKPNFSSMRVQPETRRQQSQEVQEQKRAPASGISFEFNATTHNAPIIKQLNCFFVVVAPKSHGLLMNVNSIGLPKNQTKLTITLNHESNHSQLIHLEGEEKPSSYLLTQDGNSKIAIHLQSFTPIDWSHISFDILFTVYRKASNSGCPNNRWFDCGDNICVPASLVCDKTPHCPNGNDEMIFYKCYSALFWSMALTASLVLVLVITISIIVLISRRRQGRLNRLNSLSDNVLTADADNLSSKLDLSDNHHRNQSASYLKSNLFFNGFENPVWTNTPTKQQLQQQQHPSITTSNQPRSSQQHRPSLVDGPHLGLDLAVASASGVHR